MIESESDRCKAVATHMQVVANSRDKKHAAQRSTASQQTHRGSQLPRDAHTPHSFTPSPHIRQRCAFKALCDACAQVVSVLQAL